MSYVGLKLPPSKKSKIYTCRLTFHDIRTLTIGSLVHLKLERSCKPFAMQLLSSAPLEWRGRCTQEKFQEQCVGWEDDFRLAGIRATTFNCPNTRCILAVKDFTCSIRAQCIKGWARAERALNPRLLARLVRARCTLCSSGEW